MIECAAVPEVTEVSGEQTQPLMVVAPAEGSELRKVGSTKQTLAAPGTFQNKSIRLPFGCICGASPEQNRVKELQPR